MTVATELRALLADIESAAARARALLAAVEAPAPVPPAPPAPVPAPPPPAAQVLPTWLALSPLSIVFDDYFHPGQAYEREQRVTLMSGATWPLKIWAIDPRSGAKRNFVGGVYGLLIDGSEVATVTITPAEQMAIVAVPIATELPGWHTLDIRSPSGETCVPWPVFVNGIAPINAPMPVLMSSHGMHRRGGSQVARATVPAVFAPITHPYPARATPAFSDLKDRKSLVQLDVVPWRPNDIYRPRLTNGVLNTANQQAYYWYSIAGSKWPGMACLDGPRGYGTAAMVTHLQLGRNGGLYFCDPWRFGKISPDGTITTLAGARHKAPAPRPMPLNDDTLKAACELVGDWSAVPEARRGFHELWGMAWDQRTLATDESAVPIPNNGTLEKPHLTGPVAFLADSQSNRICRVEFSKDSHDTPAKITEFITGLADPWDVVCVDGVLYVSERQANRIAAYDATSGAFIRVVVAGSAGAASVDPSRFIRRLQPIEEIRAQSCVLPEGLYHLDGWLYFGSIAMGQVRRVNLATGALQTVVADIAYSRGGSNFCKIAVSDGTFGPRGTVFFVTWAIANQGRPLAYLPDGKPWAWAGVGAGLSGPGRAWETLGYGSAVGVGQGRLVCGTSSEGVHSHQLALPGELPTANARWEVLRKAYDAAGLEITHGPGGWGYYGLPMPWGISPEIDEYLRGYGHTQ